MLVFVAWSEMHTFEQTIVRPVMCAGTGVHTGAKTRLSLAPAKSGFGIRFRRSDLAAHDIKAHVSNVSASAYGTSLSNSAGEWVATVEHILAACIGMGIDNVLIEVDGPEVPIMDGSSSVFCELIEMAGLIEQNAPRKLIRILKPVAVQNGVKSARLSPSISDQLTVKAMIDFENQVIGTQRASLRLSPGAFYRDLSFARTFGLYKDVDALQARGLALGGSLDNAIIVDENNVVNPEGLRSQDEFVRHKLLDAVGDLALAGGVIAGLYEAEQPGHALNIELVQKLMDTPDAWCWETMQESETVPASKISQSAAHF